MFTRLHVALALAALSMYAALLSAELEDAFREPEHGARRTAGRAPMGAAERTDAQDAAAAIAPIGVPDTALRFSKWGLHPTAFLLQGPYTAGHERNLMQRLPLKCMQGLRSTPLVS